MFTLGWPVGKSSRETVLIRLIVVGKPIPLWEAPFPRSYPELCMSGEIKLNIHNQAKSEP